MQYRSAQPKENMNTQAGNRATVILDGDEIKFQSTIQPDLYYWSEHATPDSFMAVSQVDGYQGTEAHDDWFRYERDANDIALALAEGRL